MVLLLLQRANNWPIIGVQRASNFHIGPTRGPILVLSARPSYRPYAGADIGVISPPLFSNDQWRQIWWRHWRYSKMLLHCVNVTFDRSIDLRVGKSCNVHLVVLRLRYVYPVCPSVFNSGATIWQFQLFASLLARFFFIWPLVPSRFGPWTNKNLNNGPWSPVYGPWSLGYLANGP